MKRTRVDANLERQFLAAMVQDRPFLASASTVMEVSLLAAKPAQQIARWCLTHFKSYDDAPGKGIWAIYNAWVESEKPEEDDYEAVKDLLEVILENEDPVPINAPHLIDELSKYLTMKKVALLKDQLESSMMYGRQDEAVAAIEGFRAVTGNEATGFDPTKGKSHLIRAFADPDETVIKFPGDAGWFFDPILTRDSLVGIQGPEKRGKTWWLLEFAYRTLRGRRKVAMFEVGDLSEGQLVKRMAMRMARLPLWERQCAGIDVPYDIKVVDGEHGKEPKVLTKPEKFAAPIDIDSAYRGQKRFVRTHKLPRDKSNVMFSVHPMSSINVAGINTILQQWKSEQDFVPDVILIDYADILAPEDPREKDAREKVNETWKALRRLSQVWHACVIVPTQANAASYDVKTQGMKHFANDKRKYGHVTATIGLNQTESERKLGVMRLNHIIVRESDFQSGSCLWVAQCISLGMAMVKAAR